MSNVLGSEHIKNVTSLEGQLAELSKVHIQQQVPAYKNLMFYAISYGEVTSLGIVSVHVYPYMPAQTFVGRSN